MFPTAKWEREKVGSSVKRCLSSDRLPRLKCIKRPNSRDGFPGSQVRPLGGGVLPDVSRIAAAGCYSYETAMLREENKICRQIAHDDLALQWDVCAEVLEIAAGLPQLLPDDLWTRAGAQFGRIAAEIPSPVMLGFHFCYGDLAHHHLVEPADLSLSVRMANLAISSAKRSVNWVHMPVPMNRIDYAYFAPLRELKNSDTNVFLGLIHLHDGVEGSLKRVEVVQRYASGFGVAMECVLSRQSSSHLTRFRGA